MASPVLKSGSGDDDFILVIDPLDTDVSQLSLDELRAQRRALLTESNRAARWRRLVQARLDLAVAAASPPEELTGLPVPAPRRGDHVPAVPDAGSLGELLDEVPSDPVHLLRRLHDAQRVLSGYGDCVQAAAVAATRELVERYAAHPETCLAADARLEPAPAPGTPVTTLASIKE